MKEQRPILQVKDLSVSFNAFAGKVQAVRGVSFDLNRGETLCIVGESGSGKSVTNKAIMGILSKNAVIEGGEILYDGMDLTKLSEKQFCEIRGRRIAMVFQDPLSALNPIMKVGKQITETLCAHRNMKSDEAKKKALELMTAVGIPEPEKRFNQYPFQFSGGMRQRIVIVIALACDPEILICDEPTTALDVTIQSKILDLIRELKRQRDLSVIFITHNMGVVANMADRICVMYAGKIVEFGTSDDIFYHPAHPYTWALLSAMPVKIVYRRSESELPARREEVEHAKEEGIEFCLLTTPLSIKGDDKFCVAAMNCQKMELGEPDASGRRRPIPIEGSEYDIAVDCVIMALGTSPNPLIKSTTKGLDVNRKGGIIVEEATGKTSRDAVYAGGDAVTGAATVISAMGAGKTAAKAIDEYLSAK